MYHMTTFVHSNLSPSIYYAPRTSIRPDSYLSHRKNPATLYAPMRSCATLLPTTLNDRNMISCFSTPTSLEGSFDESHFLDSKEIEDFSALLHSIGPLDPAEQEKLHQLKNAYQAIYRLEFSDLGVTHEIDSLAAGQHHICLQRFLQPLTDTQNQPQKAEGNVILIHGYCDHTGVMNHLIKKLLTTNMNVFTVDLPGHGLSTGEPAGIEDFSEYQEVLKETILHVGNTTGQPIHLIGHSTGASVILGTILFEQTQPIDKIVLLSPLVRPKNFELAQKLYQRAVKMGKKNSPSTPQYDCQNQQYIAFSEKDSLQRKLLTTSWFGSLLKWLPKMEMENAPVHIPSKVLVLLGEKDKIIDNQYNSNLIMKKIPSAMVQTIPGAGHHLPNEIDDADHPIRSEVFSHIQNFIQPNRQ